jgi:hypothetical protein
VKKWYKTLKFLTSGMNDHCSPIVSPHLCRTLRKAMEGLDDEALSLITSFDKEVNERCSIMRENAENTAKHMRAAFELSIAVIPTCVRNMPMKQFTQSFGGDIVTATEHMLGNTSPSRARGTPGSSRKKPKPKEEQISLAELLRQKTSANGLPPRTPPKSPGRSQNQLLIRTTPTTPSKSPLRTTPTRSSAKGVRTPNNTTPQRK